VKGRAVPYGKTVKLTPDLSEVFLPGVFSRQTKDPARVKLCLEHGQVIGRAIVLEESDEGLRFEARVSSSPDIPEARKARAMLEDGLADELSVGFRTLPGGSTYLDQGNGQMLVTHKRAQLMEVSLVPWGAYGREAALSRSLLVDPTEEARTRMLAESRDAARAWVAKFREGCRA